MVLEICANSLQSALNAQEGGADRIELCCNLEQGGLTPSAATIQLVRQQLSIEVFVLIRPRIGDFYYSPQEFELIQQEILFCKAQGIDGVVVGILDANNEIDIERNRILVELAKPMQITFHRAFDCLKNPFHSLAILIELGFDRVLTAGLETTALKGQTLLKTLLQKANNQIAILPGSGINSQNLFDFLVLTQAKEIHASAKKIIPPKTKHLFAAPFIETAIAEVRRLKAIMQQFA